MLFSGKITNSFLVFLDRRGVDSERIFELTDLPTEFLRDPSCWIPAADTEKFLSHLEREFGADFNDGLPTLVGHQCHELRAWGVLDSVIRMLQKPQDLFLQPHRFLSYFVSPAPPLANVVRGEASVSFDLPISNQEFPLVAEFIRSALEVLPCYLGRQMAQANWEQARIDISWAETQEALLKEDDLKPNYKPELVENLMQALDESQRQIEEMRVKLSEQGGKAQPVEATDVEFVQGLRAHVARARGHMMRLSDYLVRSQQLVTLLIGQDRANRQVQEAMKRVDWDYVKSQSSQVAQETADLLTQFERELNLKLRPGKRPVKSSHGQLDLEAQS